MSGFVQSSSGMIVQFAVFGLTTSAMILVLERKSGALQRLLTTPIRPTEVIAGHTLAMFLIVLIQEVILVLLGQVVFSVNYLRQPWAILLMMLALALWAASLGLLIGAISRREEQVIVLSLVAMFVFAAMGGAWFPLEVAGKTFAAIGHIMPTAWAIDGFRTSLCVAWASVLFLCRQASWRPAQPCSSFWLCGVFGLSEVPDTFNTELLGFHGFREKYWCVNDKTGLCQGCTRGKLSKTPRTLEVDRDAVNDEQIGPKIGQRKVINQASDTSYSAAKLSA